MRPVPAREASNVISLGRTEVRRMGRSYSHAPETFQTLPSAKPIQRGYFILYREGITNHCPGCGKTHWYIGNRTAECAFCATALDLQRIA